jgi:tight adherence protein C
MDLLFSPLGVSALVALAVGALLLAFRPAALSHKVDARLAAYLDAQANRSRAGEGELNGSFSARVLVPLFNSVVRAAARLTPPQNLEAINRELSAAGKPGNLSATDIVGIRLIAAVGCFALGLWIGQVDGVQFPSLHLLGPVGGLLMGYYLPAQWLAGRKRQRQALIQRALPDALDMLTICIEAGLAFEAGLQRVSMQWSGPLSDEFARVVSEMRLGVPRAQALRRLAERCGSLDVSSFVAVLVQADSVGTSIAQVLHTQSEQLRVLRRQRAEEKANRAPILVMLPLVFFIFPALFIVLLGPAIPKLMQAFPGG